MFTGFTTIAFITIYLQAHVGLSDAQIPYLYLAGGATSLGAIVLARRLRLHGSVDRPVRQG